MRYCHHFVYFFVYRLFTYQSFSLIYLLEQKTKLCRNFTSISWVVLNITGIYDFLLFGNSACLLYYIYTVHTTCILIMLYHWMKFQNSAQKQHVISSYHYMIGMSVTWPLTIFFMLIDQKPKIASEGIIGQVV